LFTHKAYNGYETKNGLKVYNIWSVIRHMQAVQDHKYQLKNNSVYHGSPVKPRSYWMESVGIGGIKWAYEVPHLRSELNTAVQGGIINAILYNEIQQYHLKTLRTLVHEDTDGSPMRKMAKLDVKFVDKHLFLTFLLEQGCLTYDKHSLGESQKVSFLKVPNVEIVEALVKDMRPCYVKFNHLSEKYVENCALSFKEVFSAQREVFSAQSKKLFEQELENLKSTLEECCVPLKNSQTIINHEVRGAFKF
jgi:tartrate dehydratase beta subunit/fumarate hydratase class I family protein